MAMERMKAMDTMSQKDLRYMVKELKEKRGDLSFEERLELFYGLFRTNCLDGALYQAQYIYQELRKKGIAGEVLELSSGIRLYLMNDEWRVEDRGNGKFKIWQPDACEQCCCDENGCCCEPCANVCACGAFGVCLYLCKLAWPSVQDGCEWCINTPIGGKMAEVCVNCCEWCLVITGNAFYQCLGWFVEEVIPSELNYCCGCSQCYESCSWCGCRE